MTEEIKCSESSKGLLVKCKQQQKKNNKKQQLAPYRTKKWEKAFLFFCAAIQPFGHIARRKKTHSPARKLFHTELSKWTKQGRKGGEERMVLGFQYSSCWLHWQHKSVILPCSLSPTSDSPSWHSRHGWEHKVRSVLLVPLCQVSVQAGTERRQKRGAGENKVWKSKRGCRLWWKQFK